MGVPTRTTDSSRSTAEAQRADRDQAAIPAGHQNEGPGVRAEPRRTPPTELEPLAPSAPPTPDALSAPSGRHAVHWAIRLVEIPLAAGVLVLSAPLMLWIAWVIRRGTEGPALFHQERLGLHARSFSFIKFRTMYADAHERFPDLYAYRYDADQIQRLKFKIELDPRVTPEGEWLRRTTFDELPNFWSVLKGDMALVGPRPEIPEMLPYYRGEMLRKFSVRPGITGLAQVSGRGRLGFLETVELDLDYVRRRSILLDLRILLRTLRCVLMRDGAF